MGGRVDPPTLCQMSSGTPPSELETLLKTSIMLGGPVPMRMEGRGKRQAAYTRRTGNGGRVWRIGEQVEAAHLWLGEAASLPSRSRAPVGIWIFRGGIFADTSVLPSIGTKVNAPLLDAGLFMLSIAGTMIDMGNSLLANDVDTAALHRLEPLSSNTLVGKDPSEAPTLSTSDLSAKGKEGRKARGRAARLLAEAAVALCETFRAVVNERASTPEQMLVDVAFAYADLSGAMATALSHRATVEFLMADPKASTADQPLAASSAQLLAASSAQTEAALLLDPNEDRGVIARVFKKKQGFPSPTNLLVMVAWAYEAAAAGMASAMAMAVRDIESKKAALREASGCTGNSVTWLQDNNTEKNVTLLEGQFMVGSPPEAHLAAKKVADWAEVVGQTVGKIAPIYGISLNHESCDWGAPQYVEIKGNEAMRLAGEEALDG